MRIWQFPVFLAALLAAVACCVEPGRATGRTGAEFADIAWFAGSNELAVVDLDTGEWSTYKHRAPLVPYAHRQLAAGVTLVSWIDRSLRCGFLLLDEKGRVLYRRDGYAAYEFGEGVLLALRMGEALENQPSEYAVEIVDPAAPGDARRYKNTIPLTPTGRDWRAPLESESRPPLLMTYESRAGGADYLYPWARLLKFRALAEDGSVAWTSEVTTGRLVTSLELLYTGQGIHLLYAQYDYGSGEYLLLDGASGELIWQSPQFAMPATKTKYPYLNFLDILPHEERGKVLRFPAYDSRERIMKVAEVNLQEGGIELVEDNPWLAKISQACGSVQTAPSGVGTWSEVLDGGETLALRREALHMSRAAAEVWSRSLVPEFGERLELVAVGDKLLLLVELPGRVTGLGAQGIPHLLDRQAGKEVRIPVEGEPTAFRPLAYGEQLFLLTSDDAQLVRWHPFADDGAS